MKTWEKERGTN